MTRIIFSFFCVFVAVLPIVANGQIQVDQLRKQYGAGAITLSKSVKISFDCDAPEQNCSAKATFKIQKLVLGEYPSEGLIQIPYNTFQELRVLKAQYYHMEEDGTKKIVENVKVKYADAKDYFINDIFYNDLKVKQFKCSVKLGKTYLVSYSYEIVYKDLKFLTAFYLQEQSEAIVKSQIVVQKHPLVDCSIFEFHHGPEVEKTENADRTEYQIKEQVRHPVFGHSVRGNYYLPHIIVSVRSIAKPDGTEEVLNSTQNLYDWYNTLVSELSPDAGYFNQLSATMVNDAQSEEEKISAIFSWVQQNIQYVAFEDGLAGFKPTEAEQVAKLKYGDCKGISNLLVNLLKAQGFDARHAWIGTRDNNYNYSIPSLIVDNHMICALNYKNDWQFLDGTSKSAQWNLPPASIEGKEVMIENGELPVLDTVALSGPAENEMIISGKINLSSTVPKIELTVRLTGHFKSEFMSGLAYESLRDRKALPYYFLREYLGDNILVEQIGATTIGEDDLRFTVSGIYLRYAKSKTGIVLFPFFNLQPYEKLDLLDAPTYISFPQKISLNIQVDGGQNSTPVIDASNATVGNERFQSVHVVKKLNKQIEFQQNLSLDLQHVSMDEYEAWNNFLDETASHSYYYLRYE